MRPLEERGMPVVAVELRREVRLRALVAERATTIVTLETGRSPSLLQPWLAVDPLERIVREAGE